MTPAEIVEAYFDALNRRDAAAVVALYSTTGTHEDAAYHLEVGRLRLSQTLPAWMDAYPGLRYSCQRCMIDGERAVAEYEVTHPAVNSDWRMPAVAVFECENGLIRRHTDYWDERTLRRGLTGD